jgi:hypothetical protein
VFNSIFQSYDLAFGMHRGNVLWCLSLLYLIYVSFIMKLDMFSDMLGKIHVARKFKRLSSAVVCYRHLVVILSVTVRKLLPLI